MNRGMRILLAFALCSLVSLCKSYGGYSIPPIGKLSTNPSCGVTATAIFVAASGKSINVRNYVTEHNTSKSSHTIDEIVKMVSDQSIRVRPIKADVQSLFGVVQKPFIAHLSTKGLPGHFAVVFQRQLAHGAEDRERSNLLLTEKLPQSAPAILLLTGVR